MKTTKNQEGRASLAVLALFAVVALALVPLLVFGADITPGYTFSSGERNVDHTKLNNAAAGTINTTFYSGKPSAGSDPNVAFELLLRDTSLNTFKRTTISAAFLDHAGLLNSRTAKTAPVLGDSILIADSAAGNAYKQTTLTNLLYGGTDLTGPTNESRMPMMIGGVMGSISVSNWMATMTAHTAPTNGDLVPVLTENGRAVKFVSLESIFKSQTTGTNFDGNHLIVSWDGTRLRGNRGTNLIDGVVTTNSAPDTNAAFVVLQDGVLKKTFGAPWRDLMHRDSLSLTQTVYNLNTNLSPGGAWTTITNLVASITPRSVNSKVLVRVVLTACASGNSQPAMMRGLKTTGGDTPLGVGNSDGATRTEASSPIVNATEPISTVFEYLDSPVFASNVVYTAQVFATASTTVYINQTAGDANNANNIRGVSTITLTEVYK